MVTTPGVRRAAASTPSAEASIGCADQITDRLQALEVAGSESSQLRLTESDDSAPAQGDDVDAGSVVTSATPQFSE